MNLIKRFGLYILRSQVHAGILALVFALAPMFNIPFIGWISIVIVGLVTLRNGAAQGFLVLIWSAVPSIVMAFMSTDIFFLSQVLFGGFVVWLFALLLRAQYTWSSIVEMITWFAVIIVFIAHAVKPDLYGWWSVQLQHWIAEYNKAVAGEDLALTVPADSMFYLTHLATGFSTAMVCLNAIFNLLVARWWQSLIYNPGGLSREFLTIRLSYRITIGLVIVAVLLALKLSLLLDLLPILLVAFFVAGFSLVNACLVGLKRAWVWMLLFYILLVVQYVFIAPAVIVLAIVDSIIDIRKRWIIKKS